MRYILVSIALHVEIILTTMTVKNKYYAILVYKENLPGYKIWITWVEWTIINKYSGYTKIYETTKTEMKRNQFRW